MRSAEGEQFSKDDSEEILFNKGLTELNNLGLIDIGNLAAWEVSSSKQGYDLDQLRDLSPLTFWQSDGQQPHYLVIKFTKCVNIERLSIFLNYNIDESYTPDKLSIFAGTGEHDLIEVITKDFFEPIGWQHIGFENISNSGYLKCYMLKIKFISNHQNGKDCHVRCIKVMSPDNLNSISSGVNINKSIDYNDYNDDENNIDIYSNEFKLNSVDCVGFTSLKLQSESQIR